MAKGENIYKRKDGRWEGRYKKGYDENRKITYGYCYGRSYREAKEKLNQAKAEWILNWSTENTEPNKQNFAMYCAHWIRINENRLKKSTLDKYQSMLQKHIGPTLGGYKPEELNSDIVARFSRELLYEKQLAPKTVRDILSFVHKIIDYIQHNVGDNWLSPTIVYPKVERKELRILSPEEQHRLTRYLLGNLDIYKFSVLLALFSGLRLGEICALKWKYISIESKTLTVAHTLQRIKITDEQSDKKTVLQLGTPKTSSSIRTIPLTDRLVELFKEFQTKNEDAYLMTGSEKFIEPRTLQRKLKLYAAELNIPDVHFHTLRHTFATRCIESGCDTKSLSEMLGHSNVSTTMNRYVHPSLNYKREHIQKLEEAGFFPPSIKPSRNMTVVETKA